MLLLAPRLAARRSRCVFALLTAAMMASSPLAVSGSEARRTPIVRAFERTKTAIVSIHGHKTVRGDEAQAAGAREVNGMGTGVVIDERGYIITNHHVVEGVRKIQVTLADGTELVAQLVAHDAQTDLAIIKISAGKKLPVMPVGTSSDLMTGESVIAIGNAYGYEHTVTRGIVSSLHRTVQVSDSQNYEDLIQTDASINPGNSGGPLLNIDGDMIGINVAVRAGAQGIGFAIPADKAMAVAAELLSAERLSGTWHGIVPQPATEANPKGVAVKSVQGDSPAAKIALESGDVIRTVGGRSVARPVDLERALLDQKAGDEVKLTIDRKGEPLTLTLELAASPKSRQAAPDRNWDVLGMKLSSIDPAIVKQKNSRYTGGLRVTTVRSDSPAWKQGIRRGDILVGMHIWKTESLGDVSYVLGRPDVEDLAPLKFYILRGNETLFGHLPISFGGR